MSSSSTTTAPRSYPTEQHLSPRKKSKLPTDPFLELPITPSSSPLLAPNGSPISSQQTEDELPIPLLQKILLTPLLLTSFLLSLHFINHRDRRARVDNHPSSSSSSSWLSPEPYQDPARGTWSFSSAQQGRGQGPGEEGKWFLRKKHRKMAGMQQKMRI